MNLYKAMAITLAFALLIVPALAQFKGKQGERATYETLINGQSMGTSIYSVEGKYRIGNVETRRFQINESNGGRVEGYLDNNGKPIKVDIFDSTSSKAQISTAFDHQKRTATISYEAPSLSATNTTQTATQTQRINVNITSNIYDAILLTQSLRNMPVKEGYRTSFQVFNAPGAVMMVSLAPLLTMMGITIDPASLAIANATLQVTGRENIRIGNNTYDCYKIVITITQDLPPQLAALDPSLASQSTEQQYWLKTDDLLLVRSYSEESMSAQGTQQKTIYETRLTSLTYV
jgi:hypothetical protein